MKSFVGEESEGKGFLGVFEDAEARSGQKFNVGEGGGELGKDQRVVDAAAGDDELMNFCFGENETIQSVNDGQCREYRRRTD